MSKAIIFDNKPTQVSLEQGKTYLFCTCGHSSEQPFCDGSHKGTDFKPHRFTAESDSEAYLCNCKNTNNQPFCDGSHKQFCIADCGKPKAN